jgi:hypothetical protein
MKLLSRLFGRAEPATGAEEQAVLIHLDGTGLPDSIYADYDLATLEDELEAALTPQRVGEVDGNEIGSGTATVYTYGPDAERLFKTIEPTLLAYPLCQGARVVIRAGPPGAPQREIRLPSSGRTRG